MAAMFVLFTDFGVEGPYVGQMKAVLSRDAPGLPAVELMSDVPAFNTRAASHLLAALAPELPAGTVFVCVVDPGVGTATRRPVLLTADRRRFVGPDNGLFDTLAARSVQPAWWEILWRPERLSATFHGRDLFAPVAAALARGVAVPGQPITRPREAYAAAAEDLAEAIYVDGFGNVMTGIRAASVDEAARLEAGGHELGYARTFGEAPLGRAFWHKNSIGLVEISVNQGRAASQLGLEVGSPVKLA